MISKPLGALSLFYFRPLCFCAVLLMCNFAYSQEDEEWEEDEDALLALYGDEQTISIATGTKQSIAKAPAVASVITASMIKSMGAIDIDDVLERVPGLHVIISSIGYNPLYIFRGVISTFNPQVLLLLNGIPLSNLHLGDRGQSWGGMPVEAISRIEVIRGPGSAVYGADAFAGVINIVTKQAGEIDGTEVKVKAGSFNTRDGTVLVSGKLNEFDIAFAAEYHNTDGQREIIDVDAQTGLDQIFGTNASLAPGSVSLSRQNVDLRLDISNQHWRFRTGIQSRRDWGVGAGVANALDSNNRYNSDRINADLTWSDTVARYWDMTGQISYYDTTHEVREYLVIFPPGTNLGGGIYPEGFIGNPEVFERHYRANISGFFTGFSRHKIRLGGGVYSGDVHEVRESKNFGVNPTTGEILPPGSPLVEVSDTPFVFLPEDDRTNQFVFIQDIWQIANDWELTAGIRYDDYSDFGSTTNPRIALVWSTSYDLTTKVLFGQAFRAPSFAETRQINNPIALGNSELDPETIQSVEIAVDYRPNDNLNIIFNIFDYTWDDIIEFVPDAGASTSTSQNIGKQDGNGIEFEVIWSPIKSLDISSNYSFIDTKDRNGFDAVNVPNQQLFINVRWNITKQIELYSQINRVMNRERLEGDLRDEIDDYTLADINLRYTFDSSKLRLSLSVNNVFDSDAREPSPAASIPNDLPLAGRHAFAGLEYAF